jgi:hypothetical protein
VFDLFPIRQRVDQEAGVSIHGDDEVPLAALVRTLALPGGQHHPAFLIERDFACAAKHDM